MDKKMDSAARAFVGSQATRSFLLELKDAVDVDARTVQMAFSSSSPVDRGWGLEVLDHSPGAVDMGRLKDRAPLLLDHDPRQVIGVPDEVEISGDGVGRSVARLSRNPLATEVLNDLADRIRSQVSVGYQVNEMVLTERGNNGSPDVYTVTKWTPYEVSIVGLAADPHQTGVGRSLETDIKPAATEQQEANDMSENNTPEVPRVDLGAVRAEATKAETERVREIAAVGRKLNCQDLADKAIDSGTPLVEFQRQAFDALPSVEPIPNPSHVDMEPKDERAYSLTRAVRAYLDRDWSQAGLEREVSQHLAKRMGRSPQGFFVPSNALTRTITSGAGQGANLIGTDHRGDLFIEALRNASFLGQVNASFMQGLRGDLDIPKANAVSTFAFIDNEAADATATTPTYQAVNLAPTTLSGGVQMTRKMLAQSDPSVEALVERDILLGVGGALDVAAINGSGSGANPTGILNMASANVVDLGANGGAALAFADLVAMETAVGAANALFGSPAYVTNHKVIGDMKTLTKTTGVMAYENGMVNGYKVVATNAVPSNLTEGTHTTPDLSGVIFGDFSQLLVGFWGGIDIKPDEATLAARGGLTLWAFLDCDIQARHEQAFSIIVDAQTTA